MLFIFNIFWIINICLFIFLLVLILIIGMVSLFVICDVNVVGIFLRISLKYLVFLSKCVLWINFFVLVLFLVWIVYVLYLLIDCGISLRCFIMGILVFRICFIVFIIFLLFFSFNVLVWFFFIMWIVEVSFFILLFW